MIKNWKEYNEAANGTELFGRGPNFPEKKLHNTLSNKDKNVCMGMDGVFYTESDYMELYNQSLKKYNLDPSLRSFSKKNLDTLLQIISEN